MNNRIFDTYNLKWVETKIPKSYKLCYLYYVLPNELKNNDLATMSNHAEFVSGQKRGKDRNFILILMGKSTFLKIKVK